MNRYQKLLNKYVKLNIICYNNLFKDVPNHIETYRWHRWQVKLSLKEDNENNIESLKRLNIEGKNNLLNLRGKGE